MNTREEIRELLVKKEYLQRDKDKIFSEFQSRYIELTSNITNIEKKIVSLRQKTENSLDGTRI